jgi:hypothetical protein
MAPSARIAARAGRVANERPFGERAGERAPSTSPTGPVWRSDPAYRGSSGPTYVLVTLRAATGIRDGDAEMIEFWVAAAGRRERRTLTMSTPMPFTHEFTWGVVRMFDGRHGPSEYLTFGGRLDAVSVDDAVLGVLTSPTPLLRRQRAGIVCVDPGAEAVRAFLGRLRLAGEGRPGIRRLLASASPTTRYAAFLGRAIDRRPDERLRSADEARVDHLLRREARRVRAESPADWAAGRRLLKVALGD